MTGYSVEWETRAAEDLARLPPPVRRHVVDELGRLAQDPALFSRPCGPPYPPGQRFEIDVAHGGVDVLVDVVFRYGADEQTLYVSHVFHEYR